MREIKVRQLSYEAFAPYGEFKSLLNPTTQCFGSEPIKFYRDILQQPLGSKARASYSVCRTTWRELVIDVTEYHNHCAEVILPLDGDLYMHVGPASQNGNVPLDEFEVFYLPKGTMAILKPGVWHHAGYCVGENPVNALVVLNERTYATDCVVYQIPEGDQIKIVV
ncbi:MAG: ureidoglycolate lyase [Halanaerobiales bacterium]|nr:ureidoglycolate lyase [Halanaerobiales bacterium]